VCLKNGKISETVSYYWKCGVLLHPVQYDTKYHTLWAYYNIWH
jgi:hypothetical protein